MSDKVESAGGWRRMADPPWRECVSCIVVLNDAEWDRPVQLTEVGVEWGCGSATILTLPPSVVVHFPVFARRYLSFWVGSAAEKASWKGSLGLHHTHPCQGQWGSKINTQKLETFIINCPCNLHSAPWSMCSFGVMTEMIYNSFKKKAWLLPECSRIVVPLSQGEQIPILFSHLATGSLLWTKCSWISKWHFKAHLFQTVIFH